jgi:hypothetical protein
MHVEATDATEVELGSRSLQRSGPLGLWFTPNQSERHNQQDEISQAGQDSCLSVAAVTSPAPGAAQPILNSGNIPVEEGSPTQHQIAMPQEVPFLLSSTARRKYIYEAFANTHSTLLKIAKEALSSCLETHREKCPLYPLESTNFLPTRLLDIKDFERLRLVITSESDIQDRRYVPLSHEWGNPDENEKRAMTTTSATLGVRLNGFDLWSLPGRFIEVVLICHFMNIRYLWIDSLCIIQVRENDLGIPSSLIFE